MISGRTVRVYDDNVDKALKKFKKKVNNSGILWDVRNREHYEKPTTKRKIAKHKARARHLKQIQKKQTRLY